MSRMIISFSGRSGGNCDQIAAYLAGANDRVVPFRSLNVHPCAGCGYECFQTQCRYRADDVYGLYAAMLQYDQVILIVPMYGGHPSSLYFMFHERCQDYFMHNDTYEAIVQRLYIIGVYGQQETSPDFLLCLAAWFDGTPWKDRVLGIERHRYGQQMTDAVLDVPEVRECISAFVDR